MEFSFKSIALTGATGTLGIALINECIKNNIKVLALVNPGSSHISRIPENDNITVVECSLSQMETFDASNYEAEVFIHLAWGSTNRAVRGNMKPQIDNIKYSIDSVELAERLRCHTYIGAGSQAEYGRKNCAISEDMFPLPENAYGMAKLCSGQMTRSLCKEKGIRHIWPRIFSTYGPYTQETTIISTVIAKLLNSEKPSLTGCEQVWDFIYVEDAVRALLLLAEKGRDGEIYNISSGKTKTLREYIEIVRAIISPEGEIGFGDIPYGDGTVMHLEGDIEKITNEVGFIPETSFEEGIRKTVLMYKI